MERRHKTRQEGSVHDIDQESKGVIVRRFMHNMNMMEAEEWEMRCKVAVTPDSNGKRRCRIALHFQNVRIRETIRCGEITKTTTVSGVQYLSHSFVDLCSHKIYLRIVFSFFLCLG